MLKYYVNRSEIYMRKLSVAGADVLGVGGGCGWGEEVVEDAIF